MATYSSNTTIKKNSATTSSGTFFSSVNSGTIFTIPQGCYGKGKIFVDAIISSNCILYINGVAIDSKFSASSVPGNGIYLNRFEFDINCLGSDSGAINLSFTATGVSGNWSGYITTFANSP